MISTMVVELESTRVVTIGAADTVYVAFFSPFLKRRGALMRQCHEITEQVDHGDGSWIKIGFEYAQNYPFTRS